MILSSLIFTFNLKDFPLFPIVFFLFFFFTLQINLQTRISSSHSKFDPIKALYSMMIVRMRLSYTGNTYPTMLYYHLYLDCICKPLCMHIYVLKHTYSFYIYIYIYIYSVRACVYIYMHKNLFNLLALDSFCHCR